MDDFNGLFCQQPKQFKKFLTERGPFVNISDIEITNIKSFLHRIIYIIKEIKSIDDYIKWAYCLWYDRFNRRINRLLTAHPKDSLSSDGSLFWSNGKRSPGPLENNIDEFYNYIFATTNLLIKTYNINKLNFDPNMNIKELIRSYDYSKINTENFIDDPDSNFDYTTLPTIPYMDVNINPQEFEKDDDTNFHIAYITATSNCRALSYTIPTASFYETKGIAGKIIPALATTTSVVASLITLEMIKYVINNTRPIDDYQSYFVNLANNLFIPGEPIRPKKVTVNNINFTEWDNFEYSNNITMNKFIELLNKKFNTTITMVTIGQKILYADFSNNSNLDTTLYDLISNEFNINTKVQLYIGTDDDKIELPQITINI
jgi:ubiquitin-activating enzyme E1